MKPNHKQQQNTKPILKIKKGEIKLKHDLPSQANADKLYYINNYYYYDNSIINYNDTQQIKPTIKSNSFKAKVTKTIGDIAACFTIYQCFTQCTEKDEKTSNFGDVISDCNDGVLDCGSVTDCDCTSCF